MFIFEILIISLGLSMDCFAVTISNGICIPHIKKKQIFKIAFFFGVFQGIMPILGWFLGLAFKESVASIDHWISFSILSIIGLKMIIEAINEKPNEKKFNILNTKILITLSIATSIDAFVVGLSFAFLNINIIISSISIAIITFLVSILGIYIGKNFRKVISSKWAEIIGGIILIGIGTKILIEHLHK